MNKPKIIGFWKASYSKYNSFLNRRNKYNNIISLSGIYIIIYYRLISSYLKKKSKKNISMSSFSLSQEINLKKGYIFLYIPLVSDNDIILLYLFLLFKKELYLE